MTTMRAGEGLVGLIATSAEPLALSDAQAHPAFSYKPETGEEIYHSFLGVPVLRGGNTLGVLVVQNRASAPIRRRRSRSSQTTAMLLAEMIASGELQAIVRPGDEIALRRPLALKGSAVADGVGLGHVVLHEPRIIVTQIVAEDTKQELERLDAAHRRRCAPTSTSCIDDGDRLGRANIAKCSKPSACSPTIAAGCGACARRSQPASRRRPPSSACRTTRARACSARPIPTCASACTISTISPTACCTS